MNKFKWYFLIGIVLLIIIAFGFYFFYNKSIKNETIETMNQNQVEYNENDINKKDEEEKLEKIVVVLNRKSDIKKETQQADPHYTNPQNNETKEETSNQDTHNNQETEKTNNNQSNNQTSSTSVKKTINKYYIGVNYNKNVVNIYTHDENGNYTIPVKAMCCSTGKATPTAGTYTIKQKWTWLGLFGNVYGHYVTQINGNILFHSVPYTEKENPGSLEYWEYDKLRYFVFIRVC